MFFHVEYKTTLNYYTNWCFAIHIVFKLKIAEQPVVLICVKVE